MVASQQHHADRTANPRGQVRTGEALLEHYASDRDQHHRSTSPLHLEHINPALVFEDQVQDPTVVAAGAEHQGPHVPARVISTQRLPTPRGHFQHVKNTHVSNNHLSPQGIQRGLRLFVDANLVHRSGSPQACPQPLAHLVGRYCARW